jgi:cell wall-associated NlpC family hydrolase
MLNEEKRKIATRIAWASVGVPYQWGGDDFLRGFDCSGFVIELLKSVGILPRTGDWTAEQLSNKFMQVDNPVEGCLVFWQNNNKIIHVEYCLNEELAIGASGGGSKTNSLNDAINQNAYIKIRPMFTRPGIAKYVDPFL